VWSAAAGRSPSGHTREARVPPYRSGFPGDTLDPAWTQNVTHDFNVDSAKSPIVSKRYLIIQTLRCGLSNLYAR
jgi:hypothetical protein